LKLINNQKDIGLQDQFDEVIKACDTVMQKSQELLKEQNKK
jgi:hypothetical protein